MDEQRREEQERERGERGEPAAPGQPRVGRPRAPRPDAGSMPAATPSGPGTAHDRRSFLPRVPRAVSLSDSIVSRTPAGPGGPGSGLNLWLPGRRRASPLARPRERANGRAHAMGCTERAPRHPAGARRARPRARAPNSARINARSNEAAHGRGPAPRRARARGMGFARGPLAGRRGLQCPGRARGATPGASPGPDRSRPAVRPATARCGQAGAVDAPRGVGFRVTFTGPHGPRNPVRAPASR